MRGPEEVPDGGKVVDGRKQSRERVFFGALVDVEDDDGAAIRYQVVGVDEVDAKAGRVSWQSPVGRALLGRRVDDTVRVTWHAGERELTIVAIDYLQDPPPGDTADARRRFADAADATGEEPEAAPRATPARRRAGGAKKRR